MFLNYFKTAWRNLISNKVFAVIKILGLSLGLTVCMLIFLYTKDEVSYDRFHANKDELFRIIQTLQAGDMPPQTIGITTPVMGEAFVKSIPEVKQFVRINGESVTVKKHNDVITENSMFVDSNFFSVFSFPLAEGNKVTVLRSPNSVVISKDMAKKYFDDYDAIGKVLQVKRNDAFENYTVTGIAENLPQNSSIKSGIFFPIQYNLQGRGNPWLGGSLNSFLLLSPGADVKNVTAKMQALYIKNTKEFTAKAEKEQGMKFKATLDLQPLTDIHLSKKAGPGNGMTDESNPLYSYILSSIAVLILIIACINFINLAVAQSLKRSKEIGIRKVVGGSRKQVIKQFFTESFLVSFIAFVIAITLMALLLPFFNELANKKLNLSYLSDGYLYGGFFLLLIVTTFISGFYPSLVLSAFQPVKVLYSRQKLMGRNYLTKGLIVLQFTLAIFLIIGAIAVYSQLNFLLNANLGYDSRNLVRVALPPGNQGDKLAALFKSELSNHPDIISVAARINGRNISGIIADGKQIVIEINRIDDRYLPAFKIPIIAGRNFSSDYPSDSAKSVIVNETFVNDAGWKVNDAVGKTIISMDETKQEFTIIGVIKDYHFTSLKEKIAPELFTMNPYMSYGEIWVKIEPDNIPEALYALQNTFKKLAPNFPYSYEFKDDINAKNYEAEEKWKLVISIASGLFIFISCMGLLGLVMLSIEHRTKEIGIRKVLGAAASKIVLLISKEFILLIAIASVIAIPAGYYFTNKWLQDFPYRITMGWWMFALAGIIAVVIAMITVSLQALKAAMANPVKCLRID